MLLLGLVLVFNVVPEAYSQVETLRTDFIKKYSQWAVNEMHYSGIPASITMAQALLESQYGTSELAVNANNHFGIKCQSPWSGKTYQYQDDDDNTCFRHYDSVWESWRDHSHFLMYRPRYAFLFDLDSHDYEGWAHGLKKAGYATNPQYAHLLIKLIRDYNLQQLDSMLPDLPSLAIGTYTAIPNEIPERGSPVQRILLRNRVEFVVAGEGDNIRKLTKELKLMRWEIRRYNEIPRGQDIKPGDVIYIQPKRRQAEHGYVSHRIEAGETMYSISQDYGIKLKALYRMNRMDYGMEPAVGEMIWLRGRKPANQR
ncbi:MAG: LysM peptidoglycan-binding domain-containing protein [Bacteroidales bacterium]|nr:LysM peptidoglycan-binding domain-containing protein [Bacteroidales bacterium]